MYFSEKTSHFLLRKRYKSRMGAVLYYIVIFINSFKYTTFPIRYKAPDGKSYAHEMTYKYGITFEQLMDNRS